LEESVNTCLFPVFFSDLDRLSPGIEQFYGLSAKVKGVSDKYKEGRSLDLTSRDCSTSTKCLQFEICFELDDEKPTQEM
jgi:hypothetical protein